ncbi:hypothetical protein [Streptococcus infantis]|jgi:hypothetical protein|nr:hypothetical protein [Streptococcus infantis]MBZ2119174.1 hypothetical protein [Streptococcus infantis]MBZ2125228.1 hypothetical protein [Streptococcus infantis]
MNKMMVIINPTSGSEKNLDYDVSISPSEVFAYAKEQEYQAVKIYLEET